MHDVFSLRGIDPFKMPTISDGDRLATLDVFPLMGIDPFKYISLINLLKASLAYAADSAEVSYTVASHVVRGDRCLKDYGFRLSQARVDSAESAPTSPSLEVTLS
eukprot:Em0015g684a